MHDIRMALLMVCKMSLIVATIGLLLTGCASWGESVPSTSASNTPIVPSSSIDMLVQQVLNNMHLHAWNTQAMTHEVTTGGLYINWRMDDPTDTNATQPGSDGDVQHNHDPQVDLLYLTALVEYHQLHPQDHSYDVDRQRALPLILADFQRYNLPKGWIYFYLLNVGIMTHTPALQEEAHAIASNFYTNWYDPALGLVYERTHTPPDYNVDHTITCGAALIDAGTRWHQPAWIEAGEKTIAHVLNVALDPHAHLFYYSMSVNPRSDPQRGHDQSLQGPSDHDSIENDKAKPSTQGQAVDALIVAYSLTHNQLYLNTASAVLHSLYTTSGLWDQQRGGFYFARALQSGTVITDYKETRSQSLVLLALHHFNQISHNQFATQQQQLVTVLTEHFYQHTYHGFFYRLTSDFQIYRTHPGQGVGLEDYFTTEAMGGALDALQQVEMIGS